MDSNTPLVVAFSRLKEDLRDIDIDIGVEENLRFLRRDATWAVPSYLGLSISVTVGGGAAAFTILDELNESSAIATSIAIPLLRGERGATSVSTLVLYAGQPGAFVDLTADLAWLTDSELVDFVLDQHLQPPDPHAFDVLESQSRINQAIGVLIAQGRDPASADQELDLRATPDRSSRLDIANAILLFPDSNAL